MATIKQIDRGVFLGLGIGAVALLHAAEQPVAAWTVLACLGLFVLGTNGPGR